MTDKPTNISIEDLLVISQQKAKTAVALATAEKASADYKVTEAEYRGLLTGIYYKYGLSQQDKINDATGEIIYYADLLAAQQKAAEEQAAQQAAQQEAAKEATEATEEISEDQNPEEA